MAGVGSPHATGDITGIYTRNKEELSFVRTTPDLPSDNPIGISTAAIRPLNQWQGIFAVTQPLLQPSFPPSWRLGKDAVRQNKERYEFTIREVLFGVAQAYYSVVRAQAQVAVAQDTLRLAQDELKQAQARVRVGEVTKTDVLRAEVAVARAERALIDIRNALQLNFSVLTRAIGMREPIGVIEPPRFRIQGKGTSNSSKKRIPSVRISVRRSLPWTLLASAKIKS